MTVDFPNLYANDNGRCDLPDAKNCNVSGNLTPVDMVASRKFAECFLINGFNMFCFQMVNSLRRYWDIP